MSFITSASGSTTLLSSATASGFLPPFNSFITSASGSTTVELNALPGVGPAGTAGSAAPGGKDAGVGVSVAPSVIHEGGA